MLESYGLNRARAQARVNILNSEGSGWFVDVVDGQFVVRHDGKPPKISNSSPTLCLVRVNSFRTEIQLKTA
jgi:hypothetical protein